MKHEELFDLIEAKTVNIMNNNAEYIIEHHTKELEESLNGDGSPISRVLQSYLHTAINLSVVNTIDILESLGVLSLEKLEVQNPEELV